MRKTRSILEELNQISVDRDRNHVVSNRGEHIIVSAINLIEQIESHYDEKTAKDLTKGKVIGWFQGRMEWGPRALGNRSIICDPRRSDIKDILNPYFTTKKNGTGLGLSIVSKIINDHNGKIEFIPLDEGAKIKINFIK